eukprot:scaffold57678_cov16-Tisochrysis_lutea.AAC.1
MDCAIFGQSARSLPSNKAACSLSAKELGSCSSNITFWYRFQQGAWLLVQIIGYCVEFGPKGSTEDASFAEKASKACMEEVQRNLPPQSKSKQKLK